jgi:predicted DNA-binding transcriptional regulator AlpA
MLVSTKEAAKRVSISKTTLWRFGRRYEDFPRPIIIGGIKRYVTAELDHWFEAHRATGAEHASK